MALIPGCVQRTSNEVVVYTALDEDFSRPIFEDFTKETGIVVRGKFDAESTKTVGLTQAIFAERQRPRCDLFWNNEIVNTLRLERAHLLAPYAAPNGRSIPEAFRSSQDLWHGFAARARVLLVNTDRIAEADWPKSIMALADAKWKGQAGIAKPLAGTTASHAACLFATWGSKRAQNFFRQVRANCRVLGGNKGVAQAVASGELAFGITDTDDAIIEVDAGRPVAIVYPDQGDDQLGVLFIPNTLALIQGAPHAENARRLVDYLLSPEVEAKLAAGRSAQIPLNPNVPHNSRVESPQTVRAMVVDFQGAAEVWDDAAQFLRNEFARAN